MTTFHYWKDSDLCLYGLCSLPSRLDNKLVWKDRCDKQVSKANSKVGLLMRTYHFTVDNKLVI